MRLEKVARHVLMAGFCGAACLVSVGQVLAAPGYAYYVVGDPADVTATPTPGLALMGGGTDVDAAFQWMTARTGGGDLLVIRTFGTDAYNQWVPRSPHQ